MKIYFDFDRTLFDTKAFQEEIYRILKDYNIPIDLFDKIKFENKEKGFNIFNILEELQKIHSFNMNLYNALNKLIENDNIYVFDDVNDILKYLKSIHYKLFILTKGDESFQKAKIINTDIVCYFDDIIITNNHKGNLNLDYNAIFVDDSLEEIESILKNKPKQVIYINRYSKDKLEDNHVLSINSLEELKEIIE